MSRVQRTALPLRCSRDELRLAHPHGSYRLDEALWERTHIRPAAKLQSGCGEDFIHSFAAQPAQPSK